MPIPSFYHSSVSMDGWAGRPEASKPIHTSKQISSERHSPVMQVPFQVFLNKIMSHCYNFQLLTLQSELLSVE